MIVMQAKKETFVFIPQLFSISKSQKQTQIQAHKKRKSIQREIIPPKTSDLKVYLVTLSDQIIHKKIIQVEVVNKIYDVLSSCLLTLLSLTP